MKSFWILRFTIFLIIVLFFSFFEETISLFDGSRFLQTEIDEFSNFGWYGYFVSVGFAFAAIFLLFCSLSDYFVLEKVQERLNKIIAILSSRIYYVGERDEFHEKNDEE